VNQGGTADQVIYPSLTELLLCRGFFVFTIPEQKQK